MSGELSKEFHKKTFDPRVGETYTVLSHQIEGIEFKEYERMEHIPLPLPTNLSFQLQRTLTERHSAKSFSKEKNISIQELSTLLFFAAGKRGKPDERGDLNDWGRFYPSGGSRFPLEIYLLVKTSDGVNPGVYHYNVMHHRLEKMLPIEEVENIDGALTQAWSQTAPVLLFITAVWDRVMPKYQDLGYHLALIETGHLGQNLLLVATALGISSRPSISFIKEKIDEILDIHHDDAESTIYSIALGK